MLNKVRLKNGKKKGSWWMKTKGKNNKEQLITREMNAKVKTRKKKNDKTRKSNRERAKRSRTE